MRPCSVLVVVQLHQMHQKMVGEHFPSKPRLHLLLRRGQLIRLPSLSCFVPQRASVYLFLLWVLKVNHHPTVVSTALLTDHTPQIVTRIAKHIVGGMVNIVFMQVSGCFPDFLFLSPDY